MKRIFGIILILILIILIISCSRQYDPVSIGDDQESSCVSCHIDKDRLIATAEVDTTGGGEDSGEG